MKRAKRLGLATMLVFALAASAGCAAASASYFTAQEYPSVANSNASAYDEYQEISFNGGTGGGCQGWGLTGEMSAGNEKLDTSLSSSVKCGEFSFYEGAPTFKSNGCHFIYHAGAETSPGNFAGTMDIGPAGCGPLRLDGVLCKRAFGTQSGIPITLHNEGSGSTAKTVIEVNSSLKYTIAEGRWETCGKGEQSAGYRAKWRISTQNALGEPVGNSLSTVGVYLGGEGPKFEAERYPANLVGKQDSVNPHLLTLPGGRKLRCSNINLNSTLSGATSEITQSPAYSSCTAEILGNIDPAEVRVNSCHYGVSLINGGPPYSATLGVSCSKEGDALELLVWENETKYKNHEATLCHYNIAPQSGLKGIGLSNIGSGTERRIALKFESVPMAYTRVSGPLTNCGAASNTGTYTGTTNIEGF